MKMTWREREGERERERERNEQSGSAPEVIGMFLLVVDIFFPFLSLESQQRMKIYEDF